MNYPWLCKDPDNGDYAWISRGTSPWAFICNPDSPDRMAKLIELNSN